MTVEARHRDPLAELADLVREPGAAAVEAEAFGPKPGPKRVEIADMVLPPPELVDELDNSGAAAALPAPEPADEPVTLDFFGDDLPVFTRELRYPFAWAGERVEAIEVHQMTTLDMGMAWDDIAAAAREGDLYRIYGRMCRVRGTGTLLPARVLRKLPAVDGLPIVDAAYDFLSPLFRPGAG